MDFLLSYKALLNLQKDIAMTILIRERGDRIDNYCYCKIKLRPKYSVHSNEKPALTESELALNLSQKQGSQVKILCF